MVNKVKLPNFVIAGAARCGTTSLYRYLSQHPDISFPGRKEPSFFGSLSQKIPHSGKGDWTYDKDVVRSPKSYFGLYKSAPETLLMGDASTNSFFYYQKSSYLIKKVLGDIPIIIMVRNPVHTVISAYNFSNVIYLKMFLNDEKCFDFYD